MSHLSSPSRRRSPGSVRPSGSSELQQSLLGSPNNNSSRRSLNTSNDFDRVNTSDVCILVYNYYNIKMNFLVLISNEIF